MSAAARAGPRRPHARGTSAAPLLAPAWARLVAFVPLAFYCALEWAHVTEPAHTGQMAAAATVAAGVAAVLMHARGRLLLAVAAAAGCLLAAGVAPRLLWPGNWNELLAGLGAGFGDLPATNVPYRGADPWSTKVLLLLGALIGVLAAWLAFGPRRGQRQRGTAAAAPRLDVGGPLLNPDALARWLSTPRGLSFSWDHTYGSLNWPRTGHEVLRIRARTPSYWKVENLSRFDGLRWMEPRELGPTAPEASGLGGRASWRSKLHVRVRGLTTTLFVGAGTTLGIEGSPRIPIRNAPGTFRTDSRPLHPGQSYDAVVWTPRPTRAHLRAAHWPPPQWTWQYLWIDLPPAQGGPVPRPARSSALPVAQIAFPAYGTAGPPTIEPHVTDPAPPAGDVLARSAYGGVYRLAQRLREGTTTPYDYVERVLEHLAHGYTYSETPPRSAVPLADFLLRDREGYCQQSSGAMALLLGMGGVPARVSTGFTPGTLDRNTGEYVVRDTDAHSWVEAYISPYGWVTLDPTPPVGPARLAPAGPDAAPAYALGAPAGVLGVAERVTDRGTGHDAAGGGLPTAAAAAGGAALLLLPGAALFALGRLRRGERRPATEAALTELRAALAGTGRDPQPALTLHAMLRRYAGTPAEPYLRTLEAARYGGADVAPTPAMRAALRRELMLGLGPSARIGAWRAMPPARPHSRPRSTYPDAG